MTMPKFSSELLAEGRRLVAGRLRRVFRR